ncbi:MAG: class I SAM-dependent methyltransferase [Deltaproteobacteria bacterium]|nr:class I SAM-dependent methyltransferase [Candidatus Zymogenaceae bacterium]
MMTDAIHRFDERSEEYDRFRPSYPVEMMNFLRVEVGLDASHVVVDVGAGTGKLTEILLQNENRAYAVEPNDRMRVIAERNLSRYKKYISVKGTAEEMNVPDHAADFVFAAQAFHWFDVRRARQEFRRILRGGGMVVLIWNVRNTHGSDFLTAYNEILRTYSSGYAAHERDKIDDEKIGSLYGSRKYKTAYFPYSQTLSEDGLVERILSNTYAPSPDDDNYEEMLDAVRALFGELNKDGKVYIEYTTNVVYGAL